MILKTLLRRTHAQRVATKEKFHKLYDLVSIPTISQRNRGVHCVAIIRKGGAVTCRNLACREMRYSPGLNVF